MRRGRASRLPSHAGVTRAQHIATRGGAATGPQSTGQREDSIGQYEGINARIAAAEAAVHSAELDLSYCEVHAPFTGLVVNMNISNGAFARAGVEVFTMVDTRTWYVVANFRETQLRTFLRGRRWICTCSRSRASTSAAASLGWVGRCCRDGTSVNGLPRVGPFPRLDRLARASRYASKVDNPVTLSHRRLGGSDREWLHFGRSPNDSLSPSRFSPRECADSGKRQCNLSAHVGLSRRNNPDL